MKKTVFFLVMIFLLFITYSTSQSSIEVINYGELSIQIDAKIKPLTNVYEGWAIYFDFKINNTNNVPLENIIINYKLQDTKANTFILNNFIKIPQLKPYEAVYHKTKPSIQLPRAGLYNLLLEAKSNYHNIKINNESDASLIWGKVKVWELNDIFILISIILAFLYIINIYKNHLSFGEIIVSHPRFYRLSKGLNSNTFLLYLPLVFENTGNLTRAISNLAIILRNNRKNKKYFFSLENEMKSFNYTNKIAKIDFKNKKIGDIKTEIVFKEPHSPAPQFIVNPKSSITKYLLFSGKDYPNFNGGKFKVEIIGWLDGNEYREELLSFETNLKVSNAFLLFDSWEKIYDEEKKPEFIMRVKEFFRKMNNLIKRGR